MHEFWSRSVVSEVGPGAPNCTDWAFKTSQVRVVCCWKCFNAV